MSRPRFYVDHGDDAFPVVVRWRPGDPAEPLTLGEAQREIDEFAASQIQHWQMIRRGVRRLTVERVLRGEHGY